jgi:putative tricarboxylic transport membrane protein
VPLILGFFAVTEVFVQSRSITGGIHIPPKVGVDFPSLIEFWRLRLAIARSAVIGFLCGILPGVGAVLAAFVSYNEAVRWSRRPEEFGTGKLEGVVASETANNAATGAAMIPLLALGLPGGALTAMMLGVLQLHGITPGPLLFLTNKDLVWVTFGAMLVANLCILVLGYFETKTVVHLLRIPFRYIGPSILLISTVGAYALRNLVLDVWVMYLAGIAGYFIRRGGYSIPGVILGVILGRLGESAFVKTMQMFQYNAWEFFDRPIAASLIALSVVTAIVGVVKFRPARSQGQG